MSRQRFNDILKRVLVSFLLSAAVLSIANIDAVWQERIHSSHEDLVREATRQKLRTHLKEATQVSPTAVAQQQDSSSSLERLRFSLTQDELGSSNPFAALSTLAPLTELMNKGITTYRRQAYRSPNYKEEFGYDLLQYEIEHADKSKSTILAYLERPLAEGNPDQKIPVVIVMQAHQGAAKQSIFRAGALMEQSDVSLAQVQSLVTQKLNAGVPFMSVSR